MNKLHFNIKTKEKINMFLSGINQTKQHIINNIFMKNIKTMKKLIKIN